MKQDSKQMIIIADDLTGANDTGVQFARQGMQTEVLLDGAAIDANTQAAILVVDTNSRSIAADTARAKVQKVAQEAHAAGFRHFYKKVDSTLRGNVGAEIKAILDLNLHDFALVMPAFPKNGRTTVGGYYLLNGAPISTTEIARDPKTPVHETLLPRLLAQQTGLSVGHIGFAELAQGKEAVIQAMQKHLADGTRIISADAWLDDHFALAAEAALTLTSKILWVGSAALADCLPQLFHWTQKEHKNTQPVLVIAGSVSSVTRKQVEQLLTIGYELIELEVAPYLPWKPGITHPLVPQLKDALAAGKKLVLTSGYQAEVVEQTKLTGANVGLTPVQVSEHVAQMLGVIGAELLLTQEVAGVVLTGGDTAVAVCKELGVIGIRVLEEITPAIPLGEMTIKNGKTLQVVTKAGAFGAPTALVTAVQRLEN